MPLKSDCHSILTDRHILIRCPKVGKSSGSATIFKPDCHHMALPVIISHIVVCPMMDRTGVVLHC
ncbi:hypothetical protein EVA_05066 [gut metagenome]|uniref:Uncharacterized protein n=1 Tax=gut metagenome TaxID=749906 RepID=J9GI77_9ZZZZ